MPNCIQPFTKVYVLCIKIPLLPPISEVAGQELLFHGRVHNGEVSVMRVCAPVKETAVCNVDVMPEDELMNRSTPRNYQNEVILTDCRAKSFLESTPAGPF